MSWHRPRRLALGVRTRVLAWYVLLLAVSLAVAVVVVRSILIERLEASVDTQIAQEAQEFRSLVGGRDPDTGQPFGDNVAAIFDTYLARNIPGEREALLTLVDGRPYRATQAEFDLFERPELVERWNALRVGEQRRVTTPNGSVEYLAVPVLVEGVPLGVFVVAEFLDRERAEVDEAVRVTAAVSFAVLLLGSTAAWVVAGRVLTPVRILTDTARSITETDLSQRIEVTSRDELGELTQTFNTMLGRLQQAFDSQQRFAQDAGHELRTPITIVRGHLELMSDDPQDRAETVALVTDELDRMSRLVDDLLLLARAERPDFLRRDDVELTALAGEVLTKASALGDRDWQLEATATGTIDGDRQRLTQALVQLAANACQHTKTGDTVALGSSRSPGQVRLWVRDTGSGIVPEARERIFTRFARGEESRRNSSGAGLGLAIVAAITEAHDGSIELHSEVGVGSTFVMVLPTAIAPAVHRSDPTEAL